MDAVTILRQLWRQRLVVAVGLVLALVCGVVMAYRVTVGLPPKFETRRYTVGIASAEVLVDSPNSQVIDLGGGRVRTDVGALTTRARLLANLMATSPLKDHIARAAGIDPSTFVADTPSLGPSQKPAAVDVVAAGPSTNRMTVYYNETLPIITANAQASTEDVAARISSAAVKELDRYLGSVAAQDSVPDARRLVVEPLGPARHGIVQRGSGGILAAIAVLVVFALWCCAMIVMTNLARRWRQVAAEERRGVPPATSAPWAPAPVQAPAPAPVSAPAPGPAAVPAPPAPAAAPPPAPAGPEPVPPARAQAATVRGLVELPERPEWPVRNPVG
jgi:hypothetical protein